MVCDICGKEKRLIGHCVCADCYCPNKNSQIDKLKHQLAEKDKEIAELKSNLKFACEQMQILRQLMKETVKDTRHKVCEEIRENAYFDHYTDVDGKIQAVYCIEPEKLKEIEGENK